MGLGLYIVRRVMELHGGSAQLVANDAGGVALRLVLSQPMGD
jgi:nitrogen fixation/metabolism regulation signal transduction histidine kinase